MVSQFVPGELQPDQPKKGEFVLNCGHLTDLMHFFRPSEPVTVQTTDGGSCVTSWFTSCERCFSAANGDKIKFTMGFEWPNDSPTVRKAVPQGS